MPLDARLCRELTDLFGSLDRAGQIIQKQLLAEYYGTFRDRFGPDALQRLNGETLLYTMYGSGGKNHLTYWLEHKEDVAFPNRRFGSISGGSSYKLGLFFSKEAAAWKRGTHHTSAEVITLEEAVATAERIRDQLVGAVASVEALTPNGSDAVYGRLQEQLKDSAPDVQRYAWGHKYLHLMCPQQLDDFHVQQLRDFHLIRLLQTPPLGNGLYRSAGRFVAIARELDMPINHLATVINNRQYSKLYKYWCIPASYADRHIDMIATRPRPKLSKDAIVILTEAGEVSGIGRILSDAGNTAATGTSELLLPVEWLSRDRWTLPQPERGDNVAREVKQSVNRVAIEERLQKS